MTAPALLRRLAEPAIDAFENTVTVTVPTRLLTALADLDEAAELVRERRSHGGGGWAQAHDDLYDALAEVERAAKEHTSQ